MGACNTEASQRHSVTAAIQPWCGTCMSVAAILPLKLKCTCGDIAVRKSMPCLCGERAIGAIMVDLITVDHRITGCQNTGTAKSDASQIDAS